jgi:hypothetical protein
MHEMTALLHTAIPHLQGTTLVHDFTSTLAQIDEQCTRLLDGKDIDDHAINQLVRETLESLKEQTGLLRSLRGG